MPTDREWRLIYRCGFCGIEMILEADGTLPWHTPQKGREWPKTVCQGVGTREFIELEPSALESRQRPEYEGAPQQDQQRHQKQFWR
jgi:hypothetical protein